MGEEKDAAAGRLDPLSAEERLDLGAQGSRVVAQMVTVAEGDRARAIVAEDAQATIEVEVVQIEEQHVEGIGKAVLRRIEPVVHEGAYAERGPDHAASSITLTPSRSATAMAESTPSSWNP